MFSRISRNLLAVVLVASLSHTAAFAAKTTATYTTIQIKDMHCSSCAKKIANKLYRIKGVMEVRADVKKNTAYIVPEKKATPSPRAMWEAVEAAGFKPRKMIGPDGSFTSKPKK